MQQRRQVADRLPRFLGQALEELLGRHAERQLGGAEHSFGIHVAKMAGIPPSVVERADEIMGELEEKKISKNLNDRVKKISTREMQLSIFSADDPEMAKIKEWISQFDPNTLTPIEALMKLMEIKERLKK
jgi:DNA mismatch repair protein MutS